MPPIGEITIENGSLKDGAYYTSSQEVILNIDASDNLTSKENLKMLISNTELTGEELSDDLEWIPYISQEKMTLVDGKNEIYVYLKDEAGNITPSEIKSKKEFTVTYLADGATNVPSAQVAQFGTAFNISVNEPIKENKYFMGWSMKENATTESWISDDVIEAKYIKEDITLYAVWKDSARSISEVVKIGDLINYPVKYENVNTNSSSYKSSYEGWQVIGVSGDTVKIVSAGTPLTYNKNVSNEEAIEMLTTNFLNTTYASSGFSGDLNIIFSNDYTEKVESLNGNDIANITNEDVLTHIDSLKHGSLLNNGSYYYIADEADDTNLYYMRGNNGTISSTTSNTYGIRIVVTLSKDVNLNGRNSAGMWEIDIPILRVSFDVNCEDVTIEDKKYLQGENYIDLPTPTREGYEFLGWYTEIDGGTEITNGMLITLRGVQTLYAHWKAKNIEVTLDANGGTPDITTITVTYDSKYEGLIMPDMDNCRFVGWYTEKTSGDKITEDTIVKNPVNHTLYAHWEIGTLSGIELNCVIKNGDFTPSGDIYDYYSVDANRLADYTVKKIIFGKKSDYATQVSGLVAENIDVNRKGEITLHRALDSDDGKYTLYVLSEDGNFILSPNSAWMFDKLYALEEIVNLHLLDTSNVTNMRDMFCDCASLKNVDLSNFNTAKVTNFIGMFARTYSMEYLDLRSFDTSSATEIQHMFTMETQENVLKRIYVSNKWVVSDKVETMHSMFTGCTSLVGGNGTKYNATKVSGDMALIDTASTPGYLTAEYTFAKGSDVNNNIKGKTAEEIANWASGDNRYDDTTVSEVIFGTTREYFAKIDGYEGAIIDNHGSGAIKVYRVPDGSGTYKAYIISNNGTFIGNSDSAWMFDKLYSLTNIVNLNMFDTSRITNMRDMFCDCARLVSLDLSNFNTAKVTSFEGMFARAYTLETLDLSSFNTANATTMQNMFYLGISATETPSDMQNVVPALKTIYVSSLWNTDKVNATQTVFSNCTNLVGGAGTVFNSANITKTYARIDTASTPGYLTSK